MARPRTVYHLIVAVLLPVVYAQQVHFTEQPVDVTVKEGAVMATITCQVADLDQTSQIVSFERDNHIISDELTVRQEILESFGLDSSRYKVKLNIHAGTLSRYYSLSVDAPGRNDTSQFRCVVCSRDISNAVCNANHIFASSDEVDLIVNYPPADSYPLCSVASPAPAGAEPNISFVQVVEGESTEFACSSEIASPPIRITWTRGGAEVNKDVQVADKDGIRVSRLKLTPTKEDNGTVLSCSVTSDAYNETGRNCSLLPLNVAPRGTDGDDTTPGGGSSTGRIIIIVLAVIIIILLVAIAVACFMKRKRENTESSGHKVEYQPAATVDTDNEDAVQIESK